MAAHADGVVDALAVSYENGFYVCFHGGDHAVPVDDRSKRGDKRRRGRRDPATLDFSEQRNVVRNGPNRWERSVEPLSADTMWFLQRTDRSSVVATVVREALQTIEERHHCVRFWLRVLAEHPVAMQSWEEDDWRR